MRAPHRVLGAVLALVALLGAVSSPAQAQETIKYKQYAVTSERAVTVTRTVLVNRGYHIVRVDRIGGTQVIYYRRGKLRHGRPKGPVQRMVIRTVRDRVVFEEAEPSLLMDIDVKLKL